MHTCSFEASIVVQVLAYISLLNCFWGLFYEQGIRAQVPSHRSLNHSLALL